MGEVVRRHVDAAWIDLEERVAVVRLQDLHLPPVLLSGSAAEIWRALDSSGDLSAVVAMVAERYGVEPNTIELYVDEWLAGAESIGLVTRTA